MKKLLFAIIPVLLSLIIFISSIFFPASIPQNVNLTQGNSLPVIIIDPGHGGFDGGAVSVNGTPEKHINLQICLLLNEYLTLFGYKTIITRETDISLEDTGLKTIRSKKTSDLHNRMSIMSKTENAVFVCIHQNSSTNSSYKGFQVFYSPNFESKSELLANCIQESALTVLREEKPRKIKECGSSVFLIYKAVKPAVLVECGFISNAEEANLLESIPHQERIAFSIANGIQKYLSQEW